jgi:chromosome segregation ATPase
MGSGDVTTDLPNSQLARILDEISGVRSDVAQLRGEVTGLRGEVTGLRGEVTELRSEVTGLREEVKALDQKVDSRLKETRPIWESALAQLKELRDDMDKGFRDIGYKMDVLAKDVLQVRADQRDLRSDQRDIEDRLNRLESA